MSGNSPGAAITVSTFASSTASGSLSAKILNNNVTVPSTGLNDGIQALMSGSGTVSHVKIDGNTINDSGTGANGIFVGTPDSGTSPNFTAIITNNTVTMNDHVNSGNGIEAVSTKGGSAVFKIEGNTVSGAGIDGIYLFQTGANTTSLERGGSASNTASAVLPANNPNAVAGPAAGTLATEVAGTVTVVANGTITLPMNAAPGGIAAATAEQAASTGNYNLHQSDLDPIVAAAIALWQAQGISASQLAALQATKVTIDHLAGGTISEESAASSPPHITIDASAAGHGWFVDPTPSDNSEFTGSGTDLFTNPTTAAAGHLDLLTAVAHEMGHVLGLDDTTSPSTAHDLMYVNLVDGERRLPDAADVAHASSTMPAPAAPTPTASTAPAETPVSRGSIDAGHGGADNFAFAPLAVNPPPALTHSFDFAALTSQFHTTDLGDAMLVRAVEDPSGHFATLQVNSNSYGLKWGPTWADVARIDGAHAGDAVNVLVDSHWAIHQAQIHVDLLV